MGWAAGHPAAVTVCPAWLQPFAQPRGLPAASRTAGVHLPGACHPGCLPERYGSAGSQWEPRARKWDQEIFLHVWEVKLQRLKQRSVGRGFSAPSGAGLGGRDRGVARGLIIPHLILPACPQCCRVNPFACWHTHYAHRRRCYSNSGWPASASCGGSTPVRPEHPVEMLLGPGIWGCVSGQ